MIIDLRKNLCDELVVTSLYWWTTLRVLVGLNLTNLAYEHLSSIKLNRILHGTAGLLFSKTAQDLFRARPPAPMIFGGFLAMVFVPLYSQILRVDLQPFRIHMNHMNLIWRLFLS